MIKYECQLKYGCAGCSFCLVLNNTNTIPVLILIFLCIQHILFLCFFNISTQCIKYGTLTCFQNNNIVHLEVQKLHIALLKLYGSAYDNLCAMSFQNIFCENLVVCVCVSVCLYYMCVFVLCRDMNDGLSEPGLVCVV